MGLSALCDEARTLGIEQRRGLKYRGPPGILSEQAGPWPEGYERKQLRKWLQGPLVPQVLSGEQ